MAKPISIDLRRRVCAAISEGLSCREAAVRFRVSASSAIRWQAQMRACGDIAPLRNGGDRKSGRIEAEAEFILRQVEERRDITLTELQEKTRGAWNPGRHRDALAVFRPPQNHI